MFSLQFGKWPRLLIAAANTTWENRVSKLPMNAATERSSARSTVTRVVVLTFQPSSDRGIRCSLYPDVAAGSYQKYIPIAHQSASGGMIISASNSGRGRKGAMSSSGLETKSPFGSFLDDNLGSNS